MTITAPKALAAVGASLFDEDHDAFRDSVKAFITSEVVPYLDDWRRDGTVPRTVIAAAGASGFLSTTVPEEFGGGGTTDAGFLAILVEETMAVGATGLALVFALHAGVVIAQLLENGSDADRARWLPGLASGELIGLPAARGSLTADDDVLTGAVLGVPGVQLADLLLVLETSADTALLLPVASPGVTVEPVLGSLAGSDAASADVTCSAVPLGEGASTLQFGADAAQRDLDSWFGLLAIAGARAAMTLTLEYVGARKVFGRQLAEFENTRFRLAELSAELMAVTAFADACLSSRNRGTLDTCAAAALRLNATTLHDRVVDQGMQLHGGYGYMREYPISLAYADARFLRLAARAYTDPRTMLAIGIGL